MRVSFITTVYNEEKTIGKFLESLFSQNKLPDEIIIVDGNSTDGTVKRIKNYESRIKGNRAKFKVLIKPGNRSVGRNEAIKNATGDIIVCSDSGNILDKDWIKNITEPFLDSRFRGNDRGGGVDVVAGYYKGKAETIFQKCLIPYVLVMPDKVDPHNFLPATRSIAFTKSIWKKVNGFDERLSHNEDYAFAQSLRAIGANIVFAKDAIVYWLPRKTLKEAFVMFLRFALGDAEAGIWRSNVLLLLARYSLGWYFIFLSLLYKSFLPLSLLSAAFVLYIWWSINKNYNYVKKKQALLILPALQLTADAAVLSGTMIGLLKRIKQFNYVQYVKQNKFLFFVIVVYAWILLFTLRWGIPNQHHPFPYHMDEWHQLQAVANTFRYGTPNTEGSANGTMFHFLYSGFYLIPFVLLQIINPFELQIDNLLMREKVFEVLRLQTIIFGVLSIFVLYKIAELITVSGKLAIFLFTFTPIWLMLSGYFKYDIALIFWILLSFLFFLRFAKDPSGRNFILAAIPSSLALAVKVSAIPLFIIFVFSYFWFSPSWKKNLKYLVAGISTFLGILLLFGFPDTLFSRGNIVLYLFENLIQTPNTTQNFEFGMNSFFYLFTHHYPILFGHGLLLIFIFAVVFMLYIFFKDGLKKNKTELFVFFSFLIFFLSIIPLQMFGGGNRSLVLLPFLVLIIPLLYKKLKAIPRVKNVVTYLIIIVAITQVYESFVWIHLRMVKSPPELASAWIENNISRGETIGIENMPIYQLVPDIIQKEFYFEQYKIKNNNLYEYEIIDSKSEYLPSLIVMTNGEIESEIVKQSPKKDLMQRIEKEGYKKVAVFKQDIIYSQISDVDYYFSWLVAAPNTISVFRK